MSLRIGDTLGGGIGRAFTNSSAISTTPLYVNARPILPPGVSPIRRAISGGVPAPELKLTREADAERHPGRRRVDRRPADTPTAPG